MLINVLRRGPHLCERVRQLFKPPMDVTALRVPDEWASLLSNAAAKAQAARPSPPKWLLAGPKNVGKSTLARLLVNRLLARLWT